MIFTPLAMGAQSLSVLFKRVFHVQRNAEQNEKHAYMRVRGYCSCYNVSLQTGSSTHCFNYRQVQDTLLSIISFVYPGFGPNHLPAQQIMGGGALPKNKAAEV